MESPLHWWVSLNEPLSRVLHTLLPNQLHTLWNGLSWLYGFVFMAAVVLILFARYMHARRLHRTEIIEQLRGVLMPLLLSTAFIICLSVSLQHLLALPGPGSIYSSHSHTTFPLGGYSMPSLGSALAVMLILLFWPYTTKTSHRLALVSYGVVGPVCSILAAHHYPIDILAGAAVGSLSLSLARIYLTYCQKQLSTG